MSSNNNIKLLKLGKNRGKGGAVKRGVQTALGRYILMVYFNNNNNSNHNNNNNNIFRLMLMVQVIFVILIIYGLQFLKFKQKVKKIHVMVLQLVVGRISFL